MINIEVISSKDKKAIGLYRFGFNSISLGFALKNDVIIRDSDFKGKQITIRVKDEGLKIVLADNHDYFLHNGKKISGTKILKKGDDISYLDLTFKVVDFNLTSDNEEDLIELYKKRIEQSSEVTPVLASIENELRELE